jgi:hypothetical protein
MPDTYSSLSLLKGHMLIFLKAASKWLLALVSGTAFLSALALGALLWNASENIFAVVGALISFLISVYIIIWFVIKASYTYRRLSDWDEDYLHSAYILIFDTTLPKGKSTGEKLLNLSKMVFPELRPEIYYSALLDKPTTSVFMKSLWNKLRRNASSENKAIFDQQINSYNLDVVFKTDKGYFIIKNYGDQVVTVDELNKFLDTASRHFSKIFRIIIVSKDYEPRLKGESVDEQIKGPLKYRFPVDLIIEENVGYTALRIGGI